MKYLLLLFAGTVLVQAQSGSTPVHCVFGSQVVNASGSCMLSGPDANISAFAMVNNSFTPTLVEVSSDSNAGVDGIPEESWSASAFASETDDYTTAGPKRPGYIQLAVDGFHGFPNIDVAGYSDGSMGLSPIELGVPFEGYISTEYSVGGGPGDGGYGGDSGWDYSFTLYEADGTTVTPVIFNVAPPAPAPEPLTAGFILAGLGLIIAAKRKEKSIRSCQYSSGSKPEPDEVHSLRRDYGKTSEGPSERWNETIDEQSIGVANKDERGRRHS